MKYRLIHRTIYSYEGAVTVSHHLARLAPRTLPGQRCPWHELEIRPAPGGRGVHLDSFGNSTAYFEIEGKHDALEVIARSLVEAVLGLNGRIFKDFKFDARATEVTTPVADVFKKRAGVCQDFAHLMLACLRSLGVPARYVSGYLETSPPPGKPRLTGADASHAWVSVFCGESAGWIDTDPTNDLLPGDRHITVAWGRDFSDVSPLRGVTLGAGGQKLDVAVDVIPVTDW